MEWWLTNVGLGGTEHYILLFMRVIQHPLLDIGRYIDGINERRSCFGDCHRQSMPLAVLLNVGRTSAKSVVAQVDVNRSKGLGSLGGQ
jgi:hypothetical protein